MTGANYPAGVFLLYPGMDDPATTPNPWLLRVATTSGVDRAIRVYCECAKVQ